MIEPRITPSIEEMNIEGKTIIKVSFSGYNRPYSCGGRYLSRCGTENRKMTTDELKKLIMHIDYSSKWEEELTNYTVDDLDDDAIYDFYVSAKNCGRLEMPEFNKEILLSNLELLQDGFANNGCYALFGKNAKIGLKLSKYATDSKVTFTDLKLVNGNIYNLLTKAVSYILDNINWRPEIGSRKRVDIPEIPEKAIREIVVNAFAHSDYESLPEIEIGIHPCKIEIYNPGSFPFDLTPFDFINKNLPSYKRNKIILDILFRSKDVEKAGTGFQRVNELCNEYGVSWTFRKEAYGFFFEFIRTNVQLNVQLNVELTDSEQLIYNLIDSNKGISKRELALRIGKSEKTVQRIVNSLIEKNAIMRVGSNKTGHWEVLK
jgi:ATP-dependent DNA helicase RecG